MVGHIAKRIFITVGVVGFVLLIALALPSISGWIRWLGGKRWQALHRLIYAAAICGVIHYLWLVKADIRKPLKYGVVLAVLLGYRVVSWVVARLKAQQMPSLPARAVPEW